MLTDKQCRAAKPAEKPYKLFDQYGLHLLVRPTGYKVWRQKYRHGGKEKQLVHGPYPEVSLAEARELTIESRRLMRRGIDPGSSAAKLVPAEEALTFERMAKKWLSLQEEGWKPKYAKTVRARIEDDLYPALGSKLLAEIRPRDLVAALESVQTRGAIEVAHRLRQYASAIFDCAIALGLVETNPAASLSKALKPVPKRRFPALLEIRSLRAFLRLVEAEPSQPATKLASRLLALTAARPGMIRLAQRDEFEGLDSAEPIWRVPAEKMKLERAESVQEAFDFIIPLSRQAVELVQVAIAWSGRRKYLFPSVWRSHAPISDSTLSDHYGRIPGYAGRHVPHGWRSSFSTIMNERAAELERPGDRAIIDLMLAHKPPGVEGIYNRAAYMKRRRQLAQEWADLLCVGLVPAADLIEGLRRTPPARMEAAHDGRPLIRRRTDRPDRGQPRRRQA